jgi:hypothetical protein
MKKIFMIIAGCFLVFNSLAQSPWSTQIPETCFCCGTDIYKLPAVPPIKGPQSLRCDTLATFSTQDCKGAAYNWTVSPSVSFSGQGTNSIKINPPFTAAQYVITITITCGKKSVSNKITVKVEGATACKPDFTILLEEMSNGTYKVSTTTQSTGAGYTHYWLLYEIASCPNGVASFSRYSIISPTGVLSKSDPAITAPGVYGFEFPGLTRGKCYKLIHYVLCCGEWKTQSKCFCLSSAVFKKKITEADLKPQQKTETIKENQLPRELKKIEGLRKEN